jgi:hypothetical protein
MSHIDTQIQQNELYISSPNNKENFFTTLIEGSCEYFIYKLRLAIQQKGNDISKADRDQLTEYLKLQPSNLELKKLQAKLVLLDIEQEKDTQKLESHFQIF